MARSWKFWTKGKLDMLRQYAPAFNTAAKKSSERIYLDLFAGEPDNIRRDTGEVLEGSSLVALDANPGFTRFRFVELDPKKAADLEVLLRARFPGKDLEVHAGDCNAVLPKILRALQPYRWAPTFAFLDQQGADLHWSTLELLSRFKKEGSTKVELWLLLPVGMALARRMPKSGDITTAGLEALDRHFGCQHWRLIYEAFLVRQMIAAEFREELVNLMRWRLQHVLGYRWTLPFEVLDERGISLYHLILATDSDAGLKIMSHLYAKAAERFPAMAWEERRRKERLKEEESGVLPLFEFEEKPPESTTRFRLGYEEPTRPFGLPDDTDC